VRKIVATAIAGAMVAAVPGIAVGAGRAAPVTDGYLTIGGPKRLAAGANLRIPIRCAVACETKAVTKLTTPSDEIGPDKATGHLGAGQMRKLVISLNDAATEDIKAHPNSRLRVAVTATSTSGEQVHAVKTFRFRGG
jgi:hypothetical protein